MSNQYKIQKVILMGKKPGAARALEWLLSKNIKVPFVVADENENHRIRLADTAAKLNIPVINETELYRLIADKDPLIADIDLVISYLYWKKIKQPLIDLPKAGCINFHPAPLPDYKSRAGYNTAILDKRNDFGASVHFINSEKFDAGPIIKVLKFPIDHDTETAHSLEKKTQDKLFELFEQTMELFANGETITTSENTGGLYLTAKELEEMKVIDQEKDSPEEINRKIRAFFFPPYTGAKLIIKGQEFTLLNNELLSYIDKLINSA